MFAVYFFSFYILSFSEKEYRCVREDSAIQFIIDITDKNVIVHVSSNGHSIWNIRASETFRAAPIWFSSSVSSALIARWEIARLRRKRTNPTRFRLKENRKHNQKKNFLHYNFSLQISTLARFFFFSREALSA